MAEAISPKQNPLLRVLKGSRLDPPPIWLMRQAGRYLPEYRQLRAEAGSFLNLCLTPELAARVTLQPVHRFDFDAAILFADILLVPHGLGQPLDYVEGEGPALEALAEPADIARLDDSKFQKSLSPVLETIRRVAETLSPEKTLIGFAGAPWTVATYMIGGGKGLDPALGWLTADPAGYERLSNLLVKYTAEYLCDQIGAGADVVQIFDSWAGAIPDKMFKRFCVQPTARIVNAIRARYPAVPIIGFPRGASRECYLAYAQMTGVTALAVDQDVNRSWVATSLQPLVPIQGNLDPEYLAGSADDLESAARAVCDAFRGGPHVFNLGHGIRPNADPENVARLVAAVREAG